MNKKKITISKKNILEIFQEVNKRLDELPVPHIWGGVINTPYGMLTINKYQYLGNKRAKEWFENKIKDDEQK